MPCLVMVESQYPELDEAVPVAWGAGAVRAGSASARVAMSFVKIILKVAQLSFDV